MCLSRKLGQPFRQPPSLMLVGSASSRMKPSSASVMAGSMSEAQLTRPLP